MLDYIWLDHAFLARQGHVEDNAYLFIFFHQFFLGNKQNNSYLKVEHEMKSNYHIYIYILNRRQNNILPNFLEEEKNLNPNKTTSIFFG